MLAQMVENTSTASSEIDLDVRSATPRIAREEVMIAALMG